MVGSRAASAAPSLGLAEPATPAIGEVVETEASPTYYRIPPNIVSFAGRTALGAQTRWSDAERDTSFALDLLLGCALRFRRDANAGLWIEGGYAWVRGHEHLAMLGIGPSYRTRGWSQTIVALVPHVIAGSIDGTSAIGARTSVFASHGPYGIELAHQLTISDGRRSHELHVALTFPFAGIE